MIVLCVLGVKSHIIFSVGDVSSIWLSDCSLQIFWKS